MNGRELKMRDSHGAVSGNDGKEVGVKCEGNIESVLEAVT